MKVWFSLNIATLLYNSVIRVPCTSCEECKEWREPDDVIAVQCCKPSEKMAQTSKVLNRHRFETKSRFLSGTQANILIIHLPVLCCAVEHICDGHSEASITG